VHESLPCMIRPRYLKYSLRHESIFISSWLYYIYIDTAIIIDNIIIDFLRVLVYQNHPSLIIPCRVTQHKASSSNQHIYRSYVNVVTKPSISSSSPIIRHPVDNNPPPGLAVPRWDDVSFFTQLRDWQVDPMSDRVIDSQSLWTARMNPPAILFQTPPRHIPFPHPTQIWRLCPLPSPSPSLPLSRLPFCSSACSRRTAVEIEGAAAVDSGGGGAGIGFQGARIHGIPRLRGCPSRVPGRRPSLLQVLRWASSPAFEFPSQFRCCVRLQSEFRTFGGFRVRVDRIVSVPTWRFRRQREYYEF
jgi:hypothetical protein